MHAPSRHSSARGLTDVAFGFAGGTRGTERRPAACCSLAVPHSFHSTRSLRLETRLSQLHLGLVSGSFRQLMLIELPSMLHEVSMNPACSDDAHLYGPSNACPSSLAAAVNCAICQYRPVQAEAPVAALC